MSAVLSPPPASIQEHALYYVGLGWKLCRIPPGSKGPRDSSWNTPTLYIGDVQTVHEALGDGQHGIGLIHGPSGTCAVDVDSIGDFQACLAEYGFDLEQLFAGAPRIVGAPGHDKAIFLLPPDVPDACHKLVWPPRAPGEKPVTVFELRAGAVQDVLPPTMHPGTGAPYAWRRAPWEVGAIPALPRPLAEFWRNWDKLKLQLLDLCPWKVKAEAPPPAPARRVSGRNQNVVGAFNGATSIAEALRRYGYEPRGKRYLAPTSSTGLAGVVLLDDGHFFSHHASDPMSDGKRHDAFDLFCHYEHGGSFSRAIRAAAEQLGIERESRTMLPEPIAVDGEVVAPPVPEKRKPVPAQLLTPPGVLAHIVEYDLSTAAKPQPQLAVQGALALASVVLGRRYVTDRRNHPALYLANIAKSGEGKEHVKGVLERCLQAAGLERLINGGYASAQGVIAKLEHEPAHITFIDEFGRVLESAKRSSATHRTDALTQLMETFTRCDGILLDTARSTRGLSGRDAAEANRRKIFNPAITIMATSTPESFYESLSDRAVSDGFLGRFIIVESTEPRRAHRGSPGKDPPPEITQWIRTVRARIPGNLVQHLPEPSHVLPRLLPLCIQPAAMDAFAAFDDRLIEEMNKLDAEGLSPLMVRAKELAMRLALIVALALDPLADTVELSDAQWAIAYVDYYAHQTLELVRERVAPNDFARWQADALRLIRRAGRDGITERELFKLSRALRSLPTHVFQPVMLKLVDRGEAFAHKFPQDGRGRPRTAWVSTAYQAELTANIADTADKVVGAMSAEITQQNTG